MKTNLITQRLSIFVATAIFSLSTIQSAYAAPGNLATAPLFLSNIVEPNLFFTLDDSGSMDYEIVVEDPMPGFNVTNGLPTDVAPPTAGGSRLGYFHPTQTELYNGRGRVPPSHEDPNSTAWDRYWVLRNHNGNKIYYNPATVYTPWPGTKANGDPMFEDANPTAAPDDPVNPDHTVNLTARFEYDGSGIDVYLPTYYTWDDNNGNGIIEPSDNNTQVEILDSDTAAMQNFANWWVYYRSRMNTTKAAIGAVINNTDGTRMGLGLFNGPNSSTSNKGTPKQTALESMNDATKKRNFLTAFYGVKTPRAGTPGRESMEETGEMLINSGILSAALGGECQQNFNVFMSDGYWSKNDSFTSIGNTDTDGAGEFDGGIYSDGWSNTLADVAMKYYEEDLKTGFADKVPTIAGVDEADHQHMVNFTIAFGVNGTLDPDSDVPGSFTWPEPVHATSTTIDDMWHAALNSRGEYLNADSPEELEKSLGRAIAAVAERTATAAAVSINSAKLTTNTIVYLAEFNTNGWQGDLKAFKIKTDAQGNLDPGGELEANPTWRAATELNNRDVNADPRVIMTYNGSKGVPFQWDKLSTDQKNDLRTNPSGGLDDEDTGKARLNYLQGSRADEGGSGKRFRERLSLLADMVNSGPVFVGAPDLRWPDKAPFPTAAGKRYSEYKNGPKKTRQEIVYAGANGGFMHGFDANTGKEEFAYVANNLFSTNASEGLHYLTDPNYIHRYYNDLTPTLSDVYDGINWQTVLISGQRGGGRGIYALDVTDPTKFTNSEANADDVVMWEFSDADDPNLGFTYSRPQIGLGNDGSWVAIFGNGYNGTGDGRGKLFILKIHQGASGWVAGTDYEVISTPPGYGSPGNRNGLSSPALADIDGNGTIDRAYAGDLFGNMWVFDLTDTVSSGNWALAYNTPLFTTIGNEPITAQPTLSKHPTISDETNNEPNVMVFFGSGQYLVQGDKTSTDNNYFYGVWDKGTASRNSTHLEQQSFRNGFQDAAGNPVRVLTRRVVNYTGGQYGWYLRLPDSGERAITKPVVRGNLVFFNTFVLETAPCSVGGYGFRMAVDIVNGGAPDDPTFDVDGDNDVDDSDQAKKGGQVATVAGLRQEGFLPDPVFIENISYTADKPGLVPELKDIPEGRFSWQELIQ